MAKQVNQKIKLLKLYELLRVNTDENNPLSTNEIREMLAKQQIPCGRKALYDDIKTLNQGGYEVMCRKGRQNCYYVEDGTFNAAEIKILLDSVQGAEFITEKKTKELVLKLAQLAGGLRTDDFLENAVFYCATKTRNESVYYSVDTLNRAIAAKKKVSFAYFTYTPDGAREYKNEGKRHKVSPLALIFSENYYYLVCYCEKHGHITHYRVDRMSQVEELDEPTDERAQNGFDIKKHKAQAFHMFVGPHEQVRLQVDNGLAGVVFDKFGYEVMRRVSSGGKFEIEAEVQLSPAFFAWCASFGDKLKILAPQRVVDEFLQNMQVVTKQYEQ